MIIWLFVVVALSVLIYWALNFILLYHLSRFGVGTQPKRIAGIFLFGSIVLFAIVASTFLNLDFATLLAYLKPYA